MIIGNRIRVAVVGDVHDQWDEADHTALKGLGVDLVLFVGDFGNEAIEVVQKVASLDLPKAVNFGNHDAWYSASSWGRSRCPYDRHAEDRVQTQIDLLGEAFIGYGKLDFPAWGISVVGVRPFSWGGVKWKHRKFYRKRFDVRSFEESIDRIVDVVGQTACDHLIFVGHNGPAGLGDQPEDPCGKDWYPAGGDYGDMDFEVALSKTSALGKQVSLVTFGHMHHSLRIAPDRTRRTIHVQDQSVYLNAACAPRWRTTNQGLLRNFSLVTIESGIVQHCQLVWVTAEGTIVESKELYRLTDQ